METLRTSVCNLSLDKHRVHKMKLTLILHLGSLVNKQSEDGKIQ